MSGLEMWAEGEGRPCVWWGEEDCTVCGFAFLCLQFVWCMQLTPTDRGAGFSGPEHLLCFRAGPACRLLSTSDLWHSCAHGRPTVAPLVHLPALKACLAAHAQHKQMGQLVAGPSSSCKDASNRKPLTVEGLNRALRRHRPAAG